MKLPAAFDGRLRTTIDARADKSERAVAVRREAPSFRPDIPRSGAELVGRAGHDQVALIHADGHARILGQAAALLHPLDRGHRGGPELLPGWG
jgi:hypothetical protein